MKVVFQTVILILCILPLTISAREKRERRDRRPKHTQPIREIDRPLTLPQRQAQLSAGYMMGFSWGKDSGFVNLAFSYIPDSEGSFYLPPHIGERPLLSIPEFTYAFNDSLQIKVGFWNLPTLYFTFLNNSIVKDGVVSIAKPTLAAFVGLESLYGNSSIEGSFEFYLHGGLEGKFPFTDRLWSDAKIKMAAGNTSTLTFEYVAALGVQLNDKLALIPEFELEHWIHTRENFTSLYPQFSTTLDCNFSDHFGLDLYGIVSEHPWLSLDCSFGVILNFNW